MSAGTAPSVRSRSVLRRLAVELLLLLFGGALLAGLLLLLGPTLLSWGSRRAYEADRELLERAVVGYRTAPSALRPWPTLSGRTGEPAEGALEGFQCDGRDRPEVCSWIDIEALAQGGFLLGADVINSADSARNVTATNAPSGRYGWYVDAQGGVRSQPAFSSQTGYP
ncbi:MAG: hypothetical protein HY688_02680 [Chloroflexi bacterium]|nr:hypothetical protein [Chloroflexota bacterium]